MLQGSKGLYLILTGPHIPHIELVRAAVERRVPVVQLREKHLEDEALTDLARSLAAATRGTETLLVVNDRPDIALAAAADGVHVGSSDIDAGIARRIVGPDRLVGISTHTPADAVAARQAGADYVGIGPVFETSTKPDAEPPIGLARLRAVARAVPDLPKVAVGGISSLTAPDVMAVGADYVGVVSAVCHADDPIAALDAMLLALRERGY